MGETIKIKWKVDDGYVGHRPHYLTIVAEELAEAIDNGISEEEFIDEAVQEEFERTIAYCWEKV